MWNGKDHMVIGNQGDQFTVAFHDPLLLKRRLAGGAVPVVARACMNPGVSAVRTYGHVISQLPRLAVLYASGSLRLYFRDSMRGCVGIKEVLEDAAHRILQFLTGGKIHLTCHKGLLHSFHCQYRA